MVPGAGRKDWLLLLLLLLLVVGGARGVTVQVEGMGTIAGPPARGSRLDVGRAETREQSTAVVATVKTVRMVSVVMTNSRNDAAAL